MRKIFLIYLLSAESLCLFSQNVGIGTLNPTHAKLEVDGSVGNVAGMFGNGANSGVSLNVGFPEVGFNYYFNGDAMCIAPGYGAVMGMNPGNGDLYLGNFNGDQTFFPFSTFFNYTDRFILKQNGRIGIGISNPNAQLSVIRGVGVDGTAAFFGTAHVSHFNYGSGEDTYIRAGINSGKVIINDIPGSRVGVGTSNPLMSLHVKITDPSVGVSDGILLESTSDMKWYMRVTTTDDYGFYKYNTGTGGYNIRAYIKGSTGEYVQGSDASLKTDIETIQTTDGLQKIIRLNPVRYHMKADGSKAKFSYGFISQEVEKFFPDIVEDFEGIKMLAYNNFIPLLTKAIQEQQQQIEDLKKDNELIKNEMSELKKLILSKK